MMESKPIYHNGEEVPYSPTTTADIFSLADIPTDDALELTAEEMDKLYRQLLGTLRLVATLQGYNLTVIKRQL
jgi:hypothetical protein